MSRLRVILVTVAAIAATTPVHAQTSYLDADPVIARILDQPLTPVASVSPDRQWLLLMSRPSLPPIAELTGPELRLAGTRIDPRTNGPARSGSFTGYLLRSVHGTAERAVRTPAGARLGSPQWSPDGARFAFTVTGSGGIELWVAEVATGAARRLTGPVLNAATGQPCAWLGGADRLVCRTVPAGRGAPPVRTDVPAGPVVQETAGRAAPNRTYQDLLESPADEALFDHYFTSQVVVVEEDGTLVPIGPPGIHAFVLPSPDGRFLAVQTVARPYSYVVPMSRFPSRLEIWDRSGTVVRRVAERPLQEAVPISSDAAPVGPRGVSWQATAPATLVWAEAADGGDPGRQAAVRDRVRTLAAPFDGEPGTLAGLAMRFADVDWLAGGTAVVSERWSKTRRVRTWMVRPGAAPRLLFDRSSEDRYGDPGRFLSTVTASGTQVVQTTADGRRAFLVGTGASAEGDRPFLDEYDLATGKTTRLWRSEAPWYEQPVALLDPARRTVLTLRESATEPPDYMVRDLRRHRLTRLTAFADPAPEFAGVTKELITYQREDGLGLSATLYLPPGHDRSSGPLPFVFWAYPREFGSADAASQVAGSPYRFSRPTGASHLFLLLAGYGVLDNPTMPIVGGEGEPNDTYVEQLVSSASAAVEAVVGRGVADRNRIAVGGHSYGAFMTANLLAHTDLFRAGVARSGAYNRTLTPFGFQSEERTYWQAPDLYERMSPFTYADRITEPILFLHGMEDDNSGTFPIQSERMYAAVKGNGGRARLVMLPGEAHGYRARESVGHTLAETIRWLDAYVKGPRGP